LNSKTAFAILLALLTISVCFTAAASSSTFPFIEPENSRPIEHLSASASLVVGAGLHNHIASTLDQPTRHDIYNYITDNPGMHFRGICTALDLSVGVVQYHLDVLEHAGLIHSVMDGQNKRYFEHSAYTKTDVQLTALLRHGTAAQILTLLAENKSALHRDLALGLGVTSQALTWQMNQLKEAGLISAEKVGVNVRYSLTDPAVGQVILNLSEQLKN
jgi:predicted transcriptional regulator